MASVAPRGPHHRVLRKLMAHPRIKRQIVLPKVGPIDGKAPSITQIRNALTISGGHVDEADSLLGKHDGIIRSNLYDSRNGKQKKQFLKIREEAIAEAWGLLRKPLGKIVGNGESAASIGRDFSMRHTTFRGVLRRTGLEGKYQSTLVTSENILRASKTSTTITGIAIKLGSEKKRDGIREHLKKHPALKEKVEENIKKAAEERTAKKVAETKRIIMEKNFDAAKIAIALGFQDKTGRHITIQLGRISPELKKFYLEGKEKSGEGQRREVLELHGKHKNATVVAELTGHTVQKVTRWVNEGPTKKRVSPNSKRIRIPGAAGSTIINHREFITFVAQHRFSLEGMAKKMRISPQRMGNLLASFGYTRYGRLVKIKEANGGVLVAQVLFERFERARSDFVLIGSFQERAEFIKELGINNMRKLNGFAEKYPNKSIVCFRDPNLNVPPFTEKNKELLVRVDKNFGNRRKQNAEFVWVKVDSRISQLMTELERQKTRDPRWGLKRRQQEIETLERLKSREYRAALHKNLLNTLCASGI